MNDLLTFILQNLIEIVFSVLGIVITTFAIPWLKNTVIPWLKDKHLYDIVQKFVKAAEKYAENNDIDKKTWVINMLEAKGVAVTPIVEALIETAVEELDLLKQSTEEQLIANEEIGEE